MFSTLFIVLVVFAIAESATTAYGLLSGKAMEINPFLKWLVKKFGTYVMLEIKLVGTIIIFICIWLSESVLVVGIIGVPIMIVSILNLRTLL